MVTKTTNIVIIFLLLLMSGVLKSQDLVFSQFYAAPMQLNPGLTGVTQAPRLSFIYRNQWPTLPNAFTSYAASYDQYSSLLNSGFGIRLMSDQAGNGIYVTNRITASYAYNMRVGEETFLRGGLEVAAEQKNLNWSKLVFLDQINPELGFTDEFGNAYPTNETAPGSSSQLYPDIGAGIVLYSSQFYGGFNIRHINAPDEAWLADTEFATLPVYYSVHGGAEINISNPYNNGKKPAFISPNILFAKQGNFQQLNLGALLSMWYIYGGVWYRTTFTNSDAAIFSLGFQRGLIKVGYSYDWTISGLSGNSGGAHEVSLILNFEETDRFKRKIRGKQYNDCLKIFR